MGDAFLEGVEQFGKDWWEDFTHPQFGELRNCQNAPKYFSADCKV